MPNSNGPLAQYLIAARLQNAASEGANGLVLTGTGGDDSLSGGSGDDHITGGGGSDTLIGSEGNDTLIAGAGQENFLSGGAGNDLLDSSGQGGLFEGGAGNDTIIAGHSGHDTSSPQIVLGGDGDDLILLSGRVASLTAAYSSEVHGGAGNDTIRLEEDIRLIGRFEIGIEVLDFNGFSIFGSSANDFVSLDVASQTLGAIRLRAGDDTVNGSFQSDLIYGGSGNDWLIGFFGDDTLHGGTGDDALNGYSGNNLIRGGKGSDNIGGGDGEDTLYGGADQDLLSGLSGNDWVHGGRGNDLVYGEDGDDQLFGGSGADTLTGNTGNDTLTGGGGADIFEFFETGDDLFGSDGDSGSDVITDFSVGTRGEKIDLSRVSRIEGYRDLMDNHISEIDGNAVIDDGAGMVITLAGVSIDDLSRNDFLF
ncbi:calcium-binding protein [Leisingera sp. McT4-56]|uniref:calcium-binding protein n=1 Tax=Leisingera sp. McT4-56 TaxID=2881255 RepID=UPI001CF9253C|nr:calcium-binding protein [Leisingera sp. McT4-56]MCB4454791.1 calcium-binding protein [Leisingera sp. McT4-56]